MANSKYKLHSFANNSHFKLLKNQKTLEKILLKSTFLTMISQPSIIAQTFIRSIIIDTSSVVFTWCLNYAFIHICNNFKTWSFTNDTFYFARTLLVKTGLFINVFLNAFITWPIFVAKSNYRTHLNLSLTWILLLTVSTMMTLKSIHTFTLIWTVVVVARPIIFTRFYRTFIYICNCKVNIVNGTMMLNLKLTK